MDFNPHPPLSAFPLVIVSLLVLLELAQIKLKSEKVSTATLVFVVCSLVITPLTFLSGYLGKEHANKTFKINPDLIEHHKLYAQALLISLVPLAVFYYLLLAEKARKLFYYLSLALVFGLVSFTGYKGGSLVFVHGAAVEASVKGDQ